MTDPHAMPQWRSMDDTSRTIAYSPSSALDGPLEPLLAAYARHSREAYAICPDVMTISYGARTTNTIDLVVPPSSEPVPLHIFIHGGYWQELSKRDSFFPAPDTLSRTMAFAAIDYTLCPHVGLDEIREECCAAISRLASDAGRLNIDPERVVVTGSSAGAHLAAMACLSLPDDHLPAGVALMSGIYDLEPLIGTPINEAVGLDVATARRNSPALADLGRFPRTVIAWGGLETDEFKRQSRQFAALLRAAGRPVEWLELERRNHFDIVYDIANDSPLGHNLTALASG